VDPFLGSERFCAYGEKYVRHTKGRWAGQSLIYEGWQREFWREALEVDPDTGLRIYNQAGLGLPRKNTKSTMASHAGIFFVDSLGEGENEPEVYVAAAAKGQAGIVMGQSISMVRRSPRLLERLWPSKYTIECAVNGGIMRSLSSAAALQHGLNPSLGLIDELHAHDDDGALFTALTTGGGAREQPFTFWFSTAGVAGQGILADLYESMFSGTGTLEVRNDGCLLIYRDRVHGILIFWYGAPRDADIEDPAVWRAVNPISYLQDLTYLGKQFGELKARGALLEWRRYHLNQFLGTEDAWLRDGAWRACKGDLPLNVALPVGVGIDRSPDGEHAAIVVAQRQGDRVVVRSQVFAPESATGIVSTEAMRVHVRELRATYPLAQAVDPKTKRDIPGPAFALDRQSLGETAEMLEGDGLNVIDVSMTSSHMAPPSMTTFELITTGRLVHDGDLILAEHVANTRAKLTERGMQVTRSKHGSTQPNVAAVAMVRAVAMASLTGAEPSVYEREDRGLMEV
jgi:phage terminase large subunit-like protein